MILDGWNGILQRFERNILVNRILIPPHAHTHTHTKHGGLLSRYCLCYSSLR